MKKLAKTSLLIATLSFATLFISSPLLHNHQIDFHSHTSCPAFILSITFTTFVFSFLANILNNFPDFEYNTVRGIVEYTSYRKFNSPNNRAPPF